MTENLQQLRKTKYRIKNGALKSPLPTVPEINYPDILLSWGDFILQPNESILVLIANNQNAHTCNSIPFYSGHFGFLVCNTHATLCVTVKENDKLSWLLQSHVKSEICYIKQCHASNEQSDEFQKNTSNLSIPLSLPRLKLNFYPDFQSEIEINNKVIPIKTLHVNRESNRNNPYDLTIAGHIVQICPLYYYLIPKSSYVYTYDCNKDCVTKETGECLGILLKNTCATEKLQWLPCTSTLPYLTNFNLAYKMVRYKIVYRTHPTWRSLL